jgi:protein TonB
MRSASAVFFFTLLIVIGSTAQQQAPGVAPSIEELRALGKQVMPPRVIKRVNPDYPEELRRKKISGAVAVEFVVSENGKPEELTVKHSSNHIFDRLAVDAVKQWRFEPARVDGKPAPVHVSVEINFNLF